jgi:hypothetical protein
MTHHFRLLKRSYSNSASWQVIQQSLGQQVSMPMAQVVARFTRVFVGEIVEKGDSPSSFCDISNVVNRFITRFTARVVQARRGEKRLCPLTTYARRTGCTSRRRGVLAPLGHYVGVHAISTYGHEALRIAHCSLLQNRQSAPPGPNSSALYKLLHSPLTLRFASADFFHSVQC